MSFAVGAGTQVFGQLSTLTKAVFGDGQQRCAFLCLFRADNTITIAQQDTPDTGGVIIRIPASSINIYKRDVQGVIVMRIEEGNKVVSIECVPAEETEEAQQ